MTTAQQIAKIEQEINTAHKQGVALMKRIRALEKAHPFGWRTRVLALTVRLRFLEAQNRRRWQELHALEHPAPAKPKRYTQYDSTSAKYIPAWATAMAGYVDGLYANVAALRARFPKARLLKIAVRASTDADCLDIEPGNAVPSEAPAWVRKQHARGKRRPVVYASASEMPEVLIALEDDGIKRSEFQVFTAHYTGRPHIESGSDATQWEDHQEIFDVTLCEPWFN